MVILQIVWYTLLVHSIFMGMTLTVNYQFEAYLKSGNVNTLVVGAPFESNHSIGINGVKTAIQHRERTQFMFITMYQ